MKIERCADCGASLDGSNAAPCPNCGSSNRAVEVFVNDSVDTHDQLRTAQKRPGDKKPHHESLQGADLHRDTGEWRQRNRQINRDADWYDEEIRDPEGNVVHEAHERLSDHIGHGYDKRSAQPPTQGS